MKTIRTFLDMLLPEQHEKAFYNVEHCIMHEAGGIKPEEVLNMRVSSFQRAISNAFDWDETPEGVDFWVDVFRHPKAHTQEKYHNKLI